MHVITVKSKLKCFVYNRLPLFSCGYWNTASHPCGTFLFGHGFLHSFFKMMKSCLTAREWKTRGWARNNLSGYCCWSTLWDISRTAQLMERCGPLIKIGPVLPPSGDWVQRLFVLVYALQTWRASRICATPDKLMESSFLRIRLYVFCCRMQKMREVCALHHYNVYKVKIA